MASVPISRSYVKKLSNTEKRLFPLNDNVHKRKKIAINLFPILEKMDSR